MSPAAEQRLTVLLVDDHALLTQSLSMGLGQRSVRAEIAELDSVDHVIAQAEALRPDVVLLDLDLGGEIGDGGALVQPLVSRGLRVIVVSATSDVGRFGAALEVGAVGVLPKSVPFATLLDAVVAGAEGRSVLDDRQRRELVARHQEQRAAHHARSAPLSQLTAREQDVLGALTRGLSVAKISREHVVSEATVRSQVRSILTKLGVRSQLEAVALAARSGWSLPS